MSGQKQIKRRGRRPEQFWANLCKAVHDAGLDDEGFCTRCGFGTRAYRFMLNGEYSPTIARLRLMAEVLTGKEEGTLEHTAMCQWLFADAPRGDRRKSKRSPRPV